MNSNTNTEFYNTQPNSTTTGMSTGVPQNPVQNANTGPAYGSTQTAGSQYTNSAANPVNPGVSSTRATAGNTYEDDPAKYGKGAGQAVRGVFKGIHGAGETIRGNLLGAVDEAFGHQSGVQKNENLARKGEGEMGRY